MRRLLAVAGLLLGTGAGADVTVHGQNSPATTGDPGRYVMYVKDEQMRMDQLEGATEEVKSSVIVRFEGSPPGTLYVDHGAKKVTVVPMETVSEIGKMVAIQSDASQPIVARNETREIMGRTAEGYDFAFSGSFTPAAMAAQEMPAGMADMLKFRMNVKGTMWIVPGLDGAQELAAFYGKMAEEGVTFGGIATESSGGEPASDFTGVMAEVAEKGFPVRTEMTTDVQVDAQGPMAGMLRQMMSGAAGTTTTNTEVTSVSTDDVDSALFYDGGLPDGYKQELMETPDSAR